MQGSERMAYRAMVHLQAAFGDNVAHRDSAGVCEKPPFSKRRCHSRCRRPPWFLPPPQAEVVIPDGPDPSNDKAP